MKTPRSTAFRLTVATALIVVSFLLGQVVDNTAQADPRVQYKVLSAKLVRTPIQYEQLLNDMAAQGWEFDHTLETAGMLVFRK